MTDRVPAEPDLQVGGRYVFPGWGEYEVLSKSPYTMSAEDGAALRWFSWVVINVAKGDSADNECVVSSPYLGLCFAALVDEADRPERARRFPGFCGVAVGTEQTGPDLSLREDGKTVTTRSRMESYLDNGEGAAQHERVEAASVMWIEDTFVGVPAGEENAYPKMMHLHLEPIARRAP